MVVVLFFSPFPPPPAPAEEDDPLALEPLLLVVVAALFGDVFRCAFGSGDTFSDDAVELPVTGAVVLVIGVPNKLANSLFTGCSRDLCLPELMLVAEEAEPLAAFPRSPLFMAAAVAAIGTLEEEVLRSRLFSSKLFTREVLQTATPPPFTSFRRKSSFGLVNVCEKVCVRQIDGPEFCKSMSYWKEIFFGSSRFLT